MNTRQLKCFILLSNNLNYAKTAEEMYLSQSTVSREIKALESEIGFALFERTLKSVELTAQGEAFRNSIIPLYNSLTSIISRVKSGTDQQRLKIGFFHVASMRRIPDALRMFHERHPEIFPEIHQENLKNLLSLYNSRELDCIFAVHSILKPSENDIVKSIYQGTFTATIPKSNPLSACGKITMEMLNGCDLLLLDENSSHGSFSRFFQELVMQCRDSHFIQCASVDEQEVYLRAGIGIAFSTDYSFENYDYYAQIPVESQFLSSLPLDYAVMYHADLKSKKIDDLIRCLDEAFQK